MKKLIVWLVISGVLTGCALFNRSQDNVHSPTALSDIQASAHLAERWSTSVGHSQKGLALNLAPAFTEQAIFATDAEGLVSRVDADSGKIMWQTALHTHVTGGVGFGAGLIFVGTSYGKVFALASDTGKVRWQQQVSSEVLARPMAGEGIVVVHTGDGKLYGLNTQDGQVRWVYDGVAPELTLRGSSSPVLVQNHVLLGLHTGRVAVFDLQDGHRLWETAIAQPRGRSDLQRLVDINGDVMFDQRVIYAVTYQGRVASVDMASGYVLWQRDLSSIRTPAVDSDSIYVSDADGVLWAFDKFTGTTRWKQDALHYRGLSAPVRFASRIVVGDAQGYIHLLARDTGEIVGREQVSSAAIHARPIVDRGAMMVLSEDSVLRRFTLN